MAGLDPDSDRYCGSTPRHVSEQEKSVAGRVWRPRSRVRLGLVAAAAEMDSSPLHPLTGTIAYAFCVQVTDEVDDMSNEEFRKMEDKLNEGK